MSCFHVYFLVSVTPDPCDKNDILAIVVIVIVVVVVALAVAVPVVVAVVVVVGWLLVSVLFCWC